MTVNIGSAFTGSIGWRRLLRSVDGEAPLGEGLGACPPTVKDPPILPWVGVQTFDTRRGERGTGLLAYFALPGGPGRRPGPAFPRPTRFLSEVRARSSAEASRFNEARASPAPAH